jgi:hypothetical protein
MEEKEYLSTGSGVTAQKTRRLPSPSHEGSSFPGSAVIGIFSIKKCCICQSMDEETEQI